MGCGAPRSPVGDVGSIAGAAMGCDACCLTCMSVKSMQLHGRQRRRGVAPAAGRGLVVYWVLVVLQSVTMG